MKHRKHLLDVSIRPRQELV